MVGKDSQVSLENLSIEVPGTWGEKRNRSDRRQREINALREIRYGR